MMFRYFPFSIITGIMVIVLNMPEKRQGKALLFLWAYHPFLHPTPVRRKKTARSVRAFLPECTIVMGGHHPTTLPQAAINCRDVDFLLRGEGEVSMPVLAKILKYGGAMEDVPGIVFRKKNGCNSTYLNRHG